MKTWHFTFAAVTAIVFSWAWFGPARGYAQERPGAGATPWDGQAPTELRAFPAGGDPVGSFTRPAAPVTTNPAPSYTGGTAPWVSPGAAPAAPDPTLPYRVTANQGPWMICMTCYVGTDAPADAVKLVQELRNTYRLPAFIFNHGAEERRKEMERVMQIIQKQRDYMRQMNLTPDPTTKIRVPHMHIEEECAVLVGGYKDMESARRELDRIKKLEAPNPDRVKLQVMFIANAKGGEKVHVNPFTHGFVVRNPTVTPERAPNQPEMDLAFLKKLNSGEPLSLLQCPKRYTLAISQLQTPTVVQSRETSSSFLENLGFGKAHEDNAAKSAHNLAEIIRKVHHQEAYVLHTRFSSIVTVGGYDSPEDPRLTHDVEQLNGLLMNLTRLDQMQVVRLFPRPMPMAVPR